MKRALTLVPLLAATLLTAAGGDFESGRAAYDRGAYTEALAAWLPLAERGDPEAQYRVGRLYYYGRGVEQDLTEAARWYLAAAEQGHARSQSNLGIMYEAGRGVPADLERAAAWYARAAAQGRAVSCNNLARMYEEGRGVARDEPRAAELYELAARSGYPEAQYRLARMYEEGRGVPADPQQAHKWDRRAARSGYAEPSATAVRDEDPDGIEASATPSESGPETTAQRPRDAAGGTGATMEQGVTSGTAFEEGLEAYDRGDFAEAARAWQPAAESGDAEAQFRLGSLYRLGRGVKEDHLIAAKWYERAASQDHGMSMYMLGHLHFKGRIDPGHEGLVPAHVWFSRAAQLGIGDAKEWRDRVSAKMTRAERAEAERVAAEGEN